MTEIATASFIQIDSDDTMESDEISPANQTADLIGDGSQPYALPTLKSKHDRFKRIDATTLVKLIEGQFKDTVESFTIVDCRYPYEYQGGHIVDSLNIHTGSDLIKLFLGHSRSDNSGNITATNHNNNNNNNQARRIIIFHCEFSSERGPKLMRLLREKDRQNNKYPLLMYPELYLLDGGYRDFYKKHKEYCVPQAYRPMKSSNHRDELKTYRKRRRPSQPKRKENRMPDISFEG